MSQIDKNQADTIVTQLTTAHPNLTIETRQEDDGTQVLHASDPDGWIAETSDASLIPWWQDQLKGR